MEGERERAGHQYGDKGSDRQQHKERWDEIVRKKGEKKETAADKQSNLQHTNVGLGILR